MLMPIKVVTNDLILWQGIEKMYVTQTGFYVMHILGKQVITTWSCFFVHFNVFVKQSCEWWNHTGKSSDVTRILYLIFKYPVSALFRRINTLCERILSFVTSDNINL